MSVLKKNFGKGIVLVLMSAYVVFSSGCIVVPHDRGYHRHHGYWHHHDRYDRD